MFSNGDIMNNYFPHDSNARNSDRLIPLRAKHGAEGYGVYFMLLERLREEPTYASVKDYNMLAFDLRVDAALVKDVVENFGLFTFTDDGKCFYSEGFCKRMKMKDEKSEKARESVRKRWEKVRNKCERNTNVTESEYECNTDAIQVKESKVKKRRVKESEGNNNSLSISPSFQSGDMSATAEPSDSERENFFKIFFFRNFSNPRAEVDRFINHYSATGWVRKGEKIVDRLSLARMWSEEKNTAPTPFPRDFLLCWKAIYSAILNDADCRPMWRDLESVSIANDRITLTARSHNGGLRSLMEQNIGIIKPIVEKFYPGRILHYRIPKKVH